MNQWEKLARKYNPCYPNVYLRIVRRADKRIIGVVYCRHSSEIIKEESWRDYYVRPLEWHWHEWTLPC